MNQTTTRVLCPFCEQAIYTTDDTCRDAPVIEERARDHLVAYHPIRRRLNGKVRRAMRASIRVSKALTPA